MFQAAIVTLALVGGDYPSHAPLCPWHVYHIPQRISCAGQKCASCSRPLVPGAMPFNYRQDFNYPWSQAPCSLVPPHAAFDLPAEVPNMPEEVPAVEVRGGTSKLNTATISVAARPQIPARVPATGQK